MLERYEQFAANILSEYSMLHVYFIVFSTIIVVLFLFVMLLAWTDNHEEEQSMQKSKERLGIK